ncbi:hypothetical protein [Holdemanella biformis]|uniref:hypothetical protein n=1 Tax=Holdemanella biformis TaxID=1735 RepID=UPI0035661EEF
MLHFYTTDNVTQNQEAYNTFIESFIPLLASVPCPKCGMIGLLILYGTHPRNFINEDMVRIELLIQRVHLLITKLIANTVFKLNCTHN